MILIEIKIEVLYLKNNSQTLQEKNRQNLNPSNTYTLEKAKPDSTENVLLLKNPQFLSNYYETL